ncbi:hypothetical protein FRC03_000609 [Tulasnella sp. 419]|nr:hypothetical protein FRC02_005672 [Tulasnella sp. 418]KAG8969783.1 hypothetical protein FRC03_000609 [Tulasnella sp. 419]
MHSSAASPEQISPIANMPSQDQRNLGDDRTVVNRPGKREVWKMRARIAIALFLPTFLETLDYTVVATAQSHIASAFNKLDLQTWIGTVYVLTSTVFLPVFGSIADLLGRHWACQLSLFFFLVGSAVCTGAQSMGMMLAGRGIAGVGAAGLVTVVRIILSDSADLKEDSFMNSMLVILYAVGYSVGPVIGGALLTVDFRWIFAINLPACVLSSLLLLLIRDITKGPQPLQRLQLPESLPVVSNNEASSPRTQTLIQKLLRIDWIACIVFVGGGILVLLALSWGSTERWDSVKVIVSFVVGGILLIILVLWELLLQRYDDFVAAELEGRTRETSLPRWLSVSPRWLSLTDPMIPMNIFKSYDVCATSFAALASGMVMFSVFYFLAIYFSIVRGYTATKAGVQLIYFSPGMGIGVIIALRLISRLGQPKWPALLGLAVTPVGIGLLSMALGNDNPNHVNGFLALTGAGVGLTFAPLALQARFSQPENRIAVVIAMNLFFRTAGGTLGLAQLATVLNSKVVSYIKDGLTSPDSGFTPEQQAQLENVFGDSLNSLDSIQSLDSNLRAFVQAAFRDGCRWSFISLLPWCAVAFAVCLFLRNIKVGTTGRGVPEPEKEGMHTEGGDAKTAGRSHNIELQEIRESPEPPKTRQRRRPIGPMGWLIHGIRKLLAK